MDCKFGIFEISDDHSILLVKDKRRNGNPGCAEKSFPKRLSWASLGVLHGFEMTSGDVRCEMLGAESQEGNLRFCSGSQSGLNEWERLWASGLLPALPLTSCVSPGRSHDLSEPPFPSL